MPYVKVICSNPVCDASLSIAPENLGSQTTCKKCGSPYRLTDDSLGTEDDSLSEIPSPDTPSTLGSPRGFSLPASFGRYQILQTLGVGGMASVFLAFDSQVGRRVALKVPDFRLQVSPDARERFINEARTAGRLSQLDNSTICEVYDFGEINGVLYLTMPYIKGLSLAAWLKKEWAERGPLAVLRACDWVRTLAQAMGVAHRVGVIHRDLKPSNIMITERHQRLKIVDFGIARLAAPGDASLTDFDMTQLETRGPSTITLPGIPFGTPAYMSPEQVRGALEEMGPRTDIYSLGVIFYELLTCQQPFQSKKDPRAIFHMVLNEPPEPPSRRRPSLPPDLDKICLKAMAKEPERRYRKMADFAAAIDAYLERAKPSDPSRDGWLKRFFFASRKSDPFASPREQEVIDQPEKLEDPLAPEQPKGGVGPWNPDGTPCGASPDTRASDERDDLDLFEPGPITPRIRDGGPLKDARAYLSRGNDRKIGGDLNGAIQDYGEAIRLEPNNAGAYNNRGNARRAKGDLAGAVADCTEAIRLDPQNAGAYNNRGLTRRALGDLDGAIDDFLEAIKIDPKESRPRNNRGLAYLDKGDYAAALVDFREALYLDIRYIDAHVNYARLLATCPDTRLRNTRQAMEVATRACEQTEWKDPALLGTLALVHAETGDFSAAAKWQQKAMERIEPATPNHVAAIAQYERYRSRIPPRDGRS